MNPQQTTGDKKHELVQAARQILLKPLPEHLYRRQQYVMLSYDTNVTIIRKKPLFCRHQRSSGCFNTATPLQLREQLLTQSNTFTETCHHSANHRTTDGYSCQPCRAQDRHMPRNARRAYQKSSWSSRKRNEQNFKPGPRCLSTLKTHVNLESLMTRHRPL